MDVQNESRTYKDDYKGPLGINTGQKILLIFAKTETLNYLISSTKNQTNNRSRPGDVKDLIENSL